MSALEVRNASKRFGNLVALRDVSLTVESGELRAIIGPNGAGKTTFFNLISGLFPPTAGTIAFDGRDVTALPAHKRVELGMARTFQITEIFPDLSVFENIRIGVEAAEGVNSRPWIPRALRIALEQRIEEVMKVTGLSEKDERVVGELPHGLQRVVEVAIALSMRPRLLMLDEPTAGMAEQETEHMVDLVRRLHAKQGLSILFIEHDMDVVFGIAEQITVLDQGRVIADGRPEEIARNTAVQAAYLGDA